MSARILTFFSNKGGVGKTSLIYHLAWTFAALGKRVLVADLDPQANLTAAFLTEDQIESLWEHPTPGSTIYQAVRPLMETADVTDPLLQRINNSLYLIPGDVELSNVEENLSECWPKSMDEKNPFRSFWVLSAFWQVLQLGAEQIQADMVLVDIGPNLGAINRSALIATDDVVIPVGADLHSLQALMNLGPALQSWRHHWKRRLKNWEAFASYGDHELLQLPAGDMQAIGYVCQQHGVRLDRVVQTYDKWVSRIPQVYREAVLNQEVIAPITVEDDPYCLATIKPYRSLIPMAQEHRKPIFMLTAADGAIGSHASAVRAARTDFEVLALKIWGRLNPSESN